MPVGRGTVAGSPYLGVYFRVSDQHAIVPPMTPAHLRKELERVLKVTLHDASVADCELVGSLLAINSHGIVVGDRLSDRERAQLERVAPVVELRVRQNALGNNVLVNDRGALVHPELSEEAMERIGRALHVPVRKGTIAGLGTVGMAATATNQGVVVHPKTTESEAEVVAAALGAPVHRSTANYGVAVVGACLVANSRGFLTGTPTTPVEMVHLQEGLQVLV